MFCVKSVSFSVFLNGSPTPSFKPHRGIRQGDPLSPYLFILCSKILSRLILRAEAKGDIHGIEIARGAPSVSHLMFVDDTFLFCRATGQEMEAIKQCLSPYETWSGQKVSLEKSSLLFSPNSSQELKALIHNTSGMGPMKKDERYLGNPLFFFEK